MPDKREVLGRVTVLDENGDPYPAMIPVDTGLTEFPLPASQVTALTPPAAITGFSTSLKQSDGTQKTQVVDASGNVQPAGDVAARAVKVDASATTQPVSGTVTVANPTANPETGLAKTTDVQAVRDRLPAALDGDGGAKVHVQNFPATQPVSGTVTVANPTANPETGLATSAKQDAEKVVLDNIKAKTDNIPPLGQALAAAAVPVVLTAIQQTALTPPAAITGFALDANLDVVRGILDRLPTGTELLTNAHLTEDVDADGKPDTWTVATATGSYVAAEHSWQGVMAASGELLSQAGYVTPLRRYTFAFRAKRTAGTGTIGARLQFYDSSSTLISTFNGVLKAITEYTVFSVEALAPSNTAYANVSIQVSAASTWRIRRANLTRWDGPLEGQLPSSLGLQADTASLSVVVASQSLIKRTLAISASGDTTVYTPTVGTKIRLYWHGYSAGSGVSGVGVGLKLEGYNAGAIFDLQYLVAAGQPWARNLQGGKRYVEGSVNGRLIVNLTAAQAVNVNFELEEV